MNIIDIISVAHSPIPLLTTLSIRTLSSLVREKRGKKEREKERKKWHTTTFRIYPSAAIFRLWTTDRQRLERYCTIARHLSAVIPALSCLIAAVQSLSEARPCVQEPRACWTGRVFTPAVRPYDDRHLLLAGPLLRIASRVPCRPLLNSISRISRVECVCSAAGKLSKLGLNGEREKTFREEKGANRRCC